MEELKELRKKGFWKLFRNRSSASKDGKLVRLKLGLPAESGVES